ncbi:MAG: AAA family ATPase [Gammaproteobacteria bacterium]|nr:AAA family ATPase [Gammaproteobacteria bacterium]
MSFLETIESARAFLERNGRVSLRVLKREFDLDDEILDELVEELVDVQQVAARSGDVLSWAGPEPSNPAINESGAQAAASRQAAEGEHRQLTVMFCDLVGSTELSERLDAEALSEVVIAYQQICAASTESFDGHIAQYLGDGVLVYFGYPFAHEDDPMRAIHAALRIVGEIPGLNGRLVEEHAALRTFPLQIRIGIHTGLVVVGGVGGLGGGGNHERLALGDTVNIAARIEGKAQPDSIVVSDATRQLVRGAFVFEELGAQPLKGIEGPVALFRPVQPTGVQSRLALAGASGLTPLVGREQEVGILLERWEQAKAGHGQVVLLSGEAGIGKSRLVDVLHEHVSNEPHTWHETRGSAYHQNDAFYPVTELIERAMMFTESDTTDARLKKLERGFSYSGFPPAEILPVLADLLGLPLPDDIPPLALSADARRKRTLEILAVLPIALAQRQPLIMIVEDLHWYDPSSVETAGRSIELVHTAPVLLVATFRPEFEPPWQSSARLTHLPLQPLNPKQTMAMAHHLTGGKQLPREVRNQIAARTDGVPLFVEELTKSVLESGLVVERDERYERTDQLPELAIPMTLRDSLSARLDRLGRAKEVAQLASVLGREFSYDVLTVVSPLQPVELDRALDELVDAGLLYQRGMPPLATYIFKHALIQEAAHQSLLKRRRREYNALVATALEEHFPRRVESEPAAIARYYDEGGLPEQAVGHYERAAQRATQRSAAAEAIRHVQRALELLDGLSDTEARRRQELRLQIAMGVAAESVLGIGSPEVQRAFARARELCRELGDASELAAVLYGLNVAHVGSARHDEAHKVGEEILELGRSVEDPALQLSGYSALASASYYLGEFATALAEGRQAIALEQPDRPIYGGLGERGLLARTFAAWALWCLGHPDQALELSQQVLRRAEALAHPLSHAWALFANAATFLYRREWTQAETRAQALMDFAEEHGFNFFSAWGTTYRGHALVGQGNLQEGFASIRSGRGATGAMGSVVAHSRSLSLEAEGYLAQGDMEEALAAMTGALQHIEATSELAFAAEVHRVRGELLRVRAPTDPAQAEACFHRALDIARGQRAKSWELRAAASLARLWQQQDRNDEARALLVPVYEWFTEGFDTQDLKDAKALLDELA